MQNSNWKSNTEIWRHKTMNKFSIFVMHQASKHYWTWMELSHLRYSSNTLGLVKIINSATQRSRSNPDTMRCACIYLADWLHSWRRTKPHRQWYARLMDGMWKLVHLNRQHRHLWFYLAQKLCPEHRVDCQVNHFSSWVGPQADYTSPDDVI